MHIFTLYRSRLNLAGLILLSLLIVSCAAKRPVYQGAEYYKNLEVPPDLTEPDTSGQLVVPDPTEEALQRFRDNNKLETVITPKFDGVRVVNYAGNSWIEVDNSVEHVWLRLLEFWQMEGIELAEKRPLLGYMDTVWVKRLEPEAGFLRSFFQGFEPDQKDRFRVRLERFDEGGKTRLYIAHSRIEKVIRSDYENDFIWVSRPSDLETEREIISRMALFAGLSKPQIAQLLDNYRPYSSLIKTGSSDNTAFTMAGSMDFVWRRTVRALDRMQVQNIQQHPESSTINFAVSRVSDKDVKQDELSQSSWLMQLFSDSADEGDAGKQRQQYHITFSQIDKRVKVVIKDAENTQYIDEDGYVSGTSRAEQLRDILIRYME